VENGESIAAAAAREVDGLSLMPLLLVLLREAMVSAKPAP